MKSNFTLPKFSTSAFSKRDASNNSVSKFSKAFFFFVLLLGSFTVYSQTFPPASSCTSKDLLLVNATLPYAKCETCTDGSTVTKMLTLYINNKTGSTRTSFAFWATLIVIKANGDTDFTRSGPISKCFSTIPKNSTTAYQYGNISFLCGESLVLTNIWEAWTDASPNSTCPTLLNSTSTINPKCGIVSSLNVIAGDAATIKVTDATCTNTGSLKVLPYGGTGPYKVALGTNTPVSVAIGDSTTFTGLTAGTYDIYITDANNCTPVHLTRTINATGSVSVPTSGGDQAQCANTPVQTLTATATGASGTTITWWTLATGGTQVTSPTLNHIGDTTYYAQATNGTCTSSRTAVKLTINPTPNAPTSGGDKTECATSPVQTLTATATGASGETITWWDAATGGNQVTSPTLNSVGSVTYYAQASNASCSSARTAVKLTINETPGAPTAGSNQSACEESPIQTLTATATAPSGSTLSWWDAATGGNSVSVPSLNSVGSVTYYAQATIGSCSSSRVGVSLEIKATPGAPTVTVSDKCDGSSDLTASNFTGSLLWSTGETTASINVKSPGTYTVTQTTNGCTSPSGSGVANPKSTPSSPSVTMVTPTCTDKTFSVQVNNPSNGVTYTLTQPGNLTPPQVIDYTSGGDLIFSGLTFGDGYSVTATNDAGGCVSPAETCGNSDNATRILSPTSVQNQPLTLESSKTQVTAIPNPYNNIIRFNLQSDVSGQGSLELYNVLGQKLKTVYQGFIQKGFKQNIDFVVPGNINHSNLIYIFTVGNERKSGIVIGAK